jgi:inward rectifier potassium channel
VVHPLDDNSPIKEITPEELQRRQAGLTVSLKTFDDTFSQTVHSRTSYQFDDFVWDAKFKPAFERDETGRVILDMSKISEYDLVSH